MTQKELGQRVGLPQSHISKIEKGAVDLQLSSLVEIARALDFEVSRSGFRVGYGGRRRQSAANGGPRPMMMSTIPTL
jgi:transcriptional regulator with XRE-family HTH domain